MRKIGDRRQDRQAAVSRRGWTPAPDAAIVAVITGAERRRADPRRGPVKVMAHLMFGICVLSVDQLIRLLH